MQEIRNKIAGIINIKGHNVLASDITSFGYVAGSGYRILFNNGVEKQFTVAEHEVANLEANIVDAIAFHKHPWNGGTGMMPHFGSYERTMPEHFSMGVSAPDYRSPFNSREINKYRNFPGRNFSDRESESVNTNQFEKGTLVKLSTMCLENIKKDNENHIILRDRILTTIFQQDVDNGIVVPCFREFLLTKAMKDTWQLTEKYHNHSYDAILEIIEEEAYNFYYLLEELKVSTVVIGTDVYDNGFKNFGNVPNSNWLKNPIADIVLRDNILNFIFVNDEANGIKVPTFTELENSIEFKDTWQLSPEYTGNDYVGILTIINNKMGEFKTLLNKVSELGIAR